MQYRMIRWILPALTLSSLAVAGEVSVKESDVPGAVIKAAALRYPSGKMVRFIRETERGHTSFEIKLEVAGEAVELGVSPTGKLLIEERTIAVSKLPAAVKKGLASSRFRDATVRRAEQVTKFSKPDAPSYELVVEQAGRKIELSFNQQGKLLTEEPGEDGN